MNGIWIKYGIWIACIIGVSFQGCEIRGWQVGETDDFALQKYTTPERAEQVFAALWKAIMNNKTYFEMPKE